MLPTSILDMLSKKTYWPAVAAKHDSDYDEHVAALTSLISFGAYEDNGGEVLKGLVAQRLDLPPDRVDVESVNVTTPALFVDTNAYIVRIPLKHADPSAGKVVILAFRGTEFVGRNFLVDVLTDARAVPVEFPQGSNNFVHGGFLTAADLIWARLVEQLGRGARAGAEAGEGLARSLAGAAPLHHLYITGHSLGGAIAVLAAARLLHPPARSPLAVAQLQKCLRGVYTFGQPMVGGKDFGKFADGNGLSKLTFRHVYQHDWVPHLPPMTTGPYSHFGSERRGSAGAPFSPVTKHSRQAVTASISGALAVLPFVFRALQLVNKVAFPFSLEDHQPENYWRSCEARVTA